MSSLWNLPRVQWGVGALLTLMFCWLIRIVVLSFSNTLSYRRLQNTAKPPAAPRQASAMYEDGVAASAEAEMEKVDLVAVLRAQATAQVTLLQEVQELRQANLVLYRAIRGLIRPQLVSRTEPRRDRSIETDSGLRNLKTQQILPHESLSINVRDPEQPNIVPLDFGSRRKVGA